MSLIGSRPRRAGAPAIHDDVGSFAFFAAEVASRSLPSITVSLACADARAEAPLKPEAPRIVIFRAIWHDELLEQQSE
jgi:hypothetical protein